MGLQEGKDENKNIGSLSGTLLAGHKYSFTYVAEVVADWHPTHNGATSSGLVSVFFTAIP
ncbi:MAG: hypothetical protein JRG92_21485 [Deltaproteobacteria bacterium]|nr:hypothetical protein [Deltaproteobacteria bacterium]